MVLEFKTAYHERVPDFKLLSLTCLRQLVDAHASGNQAAAGGVPVSIRMETAALERKSYELEVEQVDNDVKRYRVWQERCKDHETAVYYVNMGRKEQLRAAGVAAATEWMRDSCALGPPWRPRRKASR